MADEGALRKRVGWLNSKGGFDNSILYDKVLEAVQQTGVNHDIIMKVLKELEAKGSEVKDPTAYVTSALRKVGGGGGQKRSWAADEAAPAQKRQKGSSGWGDDLERKLKKRVGWLNKEGGFGNNLVYDKIVEAAVGLDENSVMKILKNLEEKGASVNDPTSWVTAALRKEGGGRGGGGGGTWSNPAASYVDDIDRKLRKRIGWLNNQGGFQNGLMYEKVAEAAIGLEESTIMRILKNLEEKGPSVNEPTSWVTSALRKEGRSASWALAVPSSGSGPDDMDHRLRKRITWLNNTGGFGNEIRYDKIAEAAWGLPESTVMTILKKMEEKGAEEVKDPTAYVTSAIRKEGGGVGAPVAAPAWANSGGNYGTDDLDRKLRKRIGWLNNQGGFDNKLLYDKISEAADGCTETILFQILKQLEEKSETVNDPNSWVTNALRKERVSGPNTPSVSVGQADDALQRLGKRIRWLNNNGFDNAIRYDEIAQFSGNASPAKIMEVLKKLEEHEGKIENPTGWVVNALKKDGRTGGGTKAAKPAAKKGTIKPMFQKKK